MRTLVPTPAKPKPPGWTGEQLQARQSRFLRLVHDVRAGRIDAEAFRLGIGDLYVDDLRRWRARPATGNELAHHLARVDRNLSLADPVERALQIAEHYRRLSLATATLIGSGAGATWARHAVAGARRLARVLRRLQRDESGDLIAALIAAEERVYQEVAPTFARFNGAFMAPGEPDLRRIGDLFESFRPGEARIDGAGGQQLLSSAFQNYWRAMDTEPAAALVVAGNAMIGRHQRLRRRPFVERARALDDGSIDLSEVLGRP